METLERSRVCRLCGRNAAITIDIFAKRDNHMKKINLLLPILVHEMDLLPKHMCHPCNYKLQDFYKFYEDCLKTDGNLKGQLSWMQRTDAQEVINLPMVRINNVKIKTEPLEYDAQDTTKIILSNENLTNFEQNNYDSYPEKIVKYTAGNKCSRCGCYCGNRNWSNDEISKSCSKTKSKRHQSLKKNETDYKSRDQIRRNLFATEIFGDKNPRIQTEIPICNVSRRFLNDETTNHRNTGTDSKGLNSRQNGVDVTPKLEMVDTAMKILPRTLRPRKRHNDCTLNGVILSPTISKKTNDVTKIAKMINTGDSHADGSVLLDVKIENSEDPERNLRPRLESINYSESIRKNMPTRVDKISGRVNKIKTSLKTRIKKEKVPSLSDKNLSSTSIEMMNLEDSCSSMLVVKLEREDGTLCTNSAGTEYHKTKKNSKTTKYKIANASERKKSQKKLPTSLPLLRSQLSCYLRNGKWKKFNSFTSDLETIVGKNLSRRVSHDSRKRKKSRNGVQSLSTIFKYQDCDMCKERFASQELYRLHGCYSNKRH